MGGGLPGLGSIINILKWHKHSTDYNWDKHIQITNADIVAPGVPNGKVLTTLNGGAEWVTGGGGGGYVKHSLDITLQSGEVYQWDFGFNLDEGEFPVFTIYKRETVPYVSPTIWALYLKSLMTDDGGNLAMELDNRYTDGTVVEYHIEAILFP